MFSLFDYLKLGIGAMVGAALIATPAYLYGKSAGKSELSAALQNDKITILKEGKKIDAEAISADDDGLCLLLGGCLSDDDANQPVRRSGEDRSSAGDEQLSCEK